eukprot:scaffold2618_cov189-Skeletonema_marinoi.AAC.3
MRMKEEDECRKDAVMIKMSLLGGPKLTSQVSVETKTPQSSGALPALCVTLSVSSEKGNAPAHPWPFVP